MFDQILGWLIICSPTALSIVFILIPVPAKTENRKAHMKWRAVLILFGILFSAGTWWQQSRATKAAKVSIEDAIDRTSAQVTANLKKAYKHTIEAQDAKIDQLQKSLDEQSHDVRTISDSPFIMGTKPVKVEVTNPPHEPATSTNTTPTHEGHLTVSQKDDVSTRPDAPFKTIIIVQSDIEFRSLMLVVTCDKNLIAGEGSANGMFTMTRSGLLIGHPNQVGFQYSSGNPVFGPANPVIFNVWSSEPVTCTQASTL